MKVIEFVSRPTYVIDLYSCIFQFFVSCLSIVTFAIPRESTHGRIQIEATLVLTTVAFKFVINQTLPRISYLTYLVRMLFFYLDLRKNKFILFYIKKILDVI